MCDLDFADRIDIAVEKIGGIKKACEVVDISHPTLGRWKDGSSDPKLSNIKALAEAANVSLDWLVSGLGEEVGEFNALIPNIAKVSTETGIGFEDAIDTLKSLIQEAQQNLTEEEALLIKGLRDLDSDQQPIMRRFIIGGLNSLKNGKSIFNSSGARIKNSFKK